MSKRKYKYGIESIKKQIGLHRNIKIKKAIEEDKLELAEYYKKEIERLEEQLIEKQDKLLTRYERISLKKKKSKEQEK